MVIDTPAAAVDTGQAATPVVAEPSDEIATADTLVAEQVTGKQIIGLQIRESEQDMRMEFVLRDKVVAYLKERSENSFGYHLRGIESQIAAPEINDNPWIQALAITATEQGVDIKFVTAPEILVETRQNLVDGEPLWAINLRKATVQPIELPVTTADVAGTAAVAADPLSQQVTPTGPGESAATAGLASTVEPETPVAETQAPIVKLEIRSTNPDAKSASQLEYALELIKSRRMNDAVNLLQGLLGGVEDHKARQHLLALYQGQQRKDRFARLARESAAAYPEDALFKTEYARSLFHRARVRTRRRAAASNGEFTSRLSMTVAWQRPVLPTPRLPVSISRFNAIAPRMSKPLPRLTLSR